MEVEAAKTRRRPAVPFIVVTAFVSSLVTGVVIPLFPGLIMELTGEGLSTAAVWGGIATLIYAAMQFVCSPILGGLSDRFGRRPVMLLSLAALAVDMLLIAIAPDLLLFLVARTLSGVFAATFATANAYITDIVAPERRAESYGLVGAAFGFGFIAGPILGGLVGEYDLRAPFYAAAGLAAFTTLYGAVFVPESLPKEKRRPFSWSRANAFGTLLRLLRTPGLGTLIPVFFFSNISTWVYPAVWSYVAIAKFNWSEGEIGASIAYYGVIFVVAQAVVIRFAMNRFSAGRIVAFALFLEGLALLGIGFASNVVTLYVMVSFALITSLQEPSIKAIMAGQVGDSEHGELQGGLAALAGLAMVFSPVLYTQLFSVFNDGSLGFRFPGAPFVVASLFSFFALALVVARRRLPVPTTS
ncbi:MAG: MFS transporter [Myxococcota bacterium]